MTTADRNKTRLCIVTPVHSSAQTGGAEYQIDCLLDVLLPSDRYEVHYLARLVRPGYERDGLLIHQIGSTNASPRFGYITDAVPLYRALNEIRPDVIYQRVGCGYTAIAACFAQRHRTRMIWHVAHDDDVTPGSAIMHGRNPVRRFLEARSVAYGIRQAPLIVVQTEQQARLLELHYHRQADAVIPNFQPEPREPIDKTGPVRVVWIASLKPWKQPEIFVRIARELRDLADVQFVMVGGRASRSEDEWDRAIMREVASTPNLQYVGRLTQSEVNRLLASSHVFVNTSLKEGFPNTFIQAWMREVPVVSLAVDPDGVMTREAIGICAGSEEGMVRAVRMLASDARLRGEYGLRGKQHAHRRHSLANARLLAQLLETGRIEPAEKERANIGLSPNALP
jgi:glycosyltransferase involved in cell wall biosynthesis